MLIDIKHWFLIDLSVIKNVLYLLRATVYELVGTKYLTLFRQSHWIYLKYSSQMFLTLQSRMTLNFVLPASITSLHSWFHLVPKLEPRAL